MKKLIASTLAVLLLVQSITPATYAAKITNAKDDAAGTATTSQNDGTIAVSNLLNFIASNKTALDKAGVDVDEITNNWMSSYRSWSENGQSQQAKDAVDRIATYFQSILKGDVTYSDAEMTRAIGGPWVMQIDSRSIDQKILDNSEAYQTYKDLDPGYKDGRLDVYVTARNYHNVSAVKGNNSFYKAYLDSKMERPFNPGTYTARNSTQQVIIDNNSIVVYPMTADAAGKNTMKDVVSVVQSAMTRGNNAAATTDTATSTTEKNSTKGADFISTYRSMDLGKATALQVLQVAAIGSVYAEKGADVFNDKPTYTTLTNQFLDKYAPNFKFRVGDDVPAAAKNDTNARQESLASDWQKNYPKEYDAVYTYAKNRQTPISDIKREATAAAVAATPAQACTLDKAQEQKLFDAKIQYEKLIAAGDTKQAAEVFKTIQSITSTSTCAGTSSAVQLTQDCSTVYERYKTEYNNLIAVNAPYEKIKDIKEKLANTEKGEGCTIQTATAQTIEQHQALVAKVKKTIDFGAATAGVIPDGLVPLYCTDEALVNGLEQQLAANDLPKLNKIKENIQSILESDDNSMTKGNRRSILTFALGKAATVETKKLMATNADNKEASAVDNFLSGIAGLVDALLNSRGVTTVLGFFDGNMENVQRMIDSLDKAGGFGSFKEVVDNGGSAYNWDGNGFVLNKEAGKQSDITFAFPATRDNAKNNSNNALFTLSALKIHSYEREQDYGYTEVKPESLNGYDLTTAKGFGQAAKKFGNTYTVGLPVSEISQDMYNKLKQNGTWTSDEGNGDHFDQVNMYVAQINHQRKAYMDFDLTQPMPATTIQGSWSRFEIAANADVHEFYTNEVPKQITAKVEVNSKLIAGLEASLVFPSDEVLSTTTDAAPLAVSIRAYIANFLITANFKRENTSGNNWRISLAGSINGPSICNFTVDAHLDYQNGTEASMEIPTEDFKSAALDLNFNSNTLHFAVNDLAGLVSEIQSFNNTSENAPKDAGYGSSDPSIEDIVDTANKYIDATYSFAGDQLAVIKADIDNYAVVQYPNGAKEPVLDLAQRYIGLVDTTYVEQVFGELFGGSKDNGNTDNNTTNDYSKFYGNVWSDGSYVYANYNFTNQEGTNTSSVSPDQVSMYVFTKGEGCDSAFCLQTQYSPTYDGSNYVFDYSSIANDPTVVAVYVYASYKSPETGKSFEEKYYLIGSNDVINPSSPDTTTDCKDPKNVALPACMPHSAPTTSGCTDSTALNYDSNATKDDGTCKYTQAVTMDVAGYSLISAQDPSQFMIGFKLSTDSQNLTTPDNVALILYYADTTKSVTSLAQGADGYYAGSNSFATDDNVKSAVVNAYSTIDGVTVATSSKLKVESFQDSLSPANEGQAGTSDLSQANQSPQGVLDLLR